MSDFNRRTFCDRGIRGTALIALGSWASRALGAGPDPIVLEEKAAGFVRPRQGSDGSWSGDRQEPGITALVVTALLRSRRVAPADPAIAKGLGYL